MTNICYIHCSHVPAPHLPVLGGVITQTQCTAPILTQDSSLQRFLWVWHPPLRCSIMSSVNTAGQEGRQPPVMNNHVVANQKLIKWTIWPNWQTPPGFTWPSSASKTDESSSYPPKIQAGRRPCLASIYACGSTHLLTWSNHTKPLLSQSPVSLRVGSLDLSAVIQTSGRHFDDSTHTDSFIASAADSWPPPFMSSTKRFFPHMRSPSKPFIATTRVQTPGRPQPYLSSTNASGCGLIAKVNLLFAIKFIASNTPVLFCSQLLHIRTGSLMSCSCSVPKFCYHPVLSFLFF